MEGEALDAARLSQLDQSTTAWRESVVHPLRAIRQRLKGPVDAITTAVSADLRARIMDAELLAEQIEQALLFGLTQPPAQIAAGQDRVNLARRNVALLIARSPNPQEALDNAAIEIFERALIDAL